MKETTNRHFALSILVTFLLFLSGCNNTIKIGLEGKKPPKQEIKIPARCEGKVNIPDSEELELSCTFLIDKTSSLSEEVLSQNTWKFEQAINNSRKVKIIDVVGFGAKGQTIWADSAFRFTFPERVVKNTFDKTAFREQVKAECGSRKSCIDKKEREEREKSDKTFSELQNNCATDETQIISDIIKKILESPIMEAQCTSIYYVVERALLTESERIIIVTDGEQTCSQPALNNLKPGKNQKILILITPLKNEAISENFNQRIQFVKDLIPEAEVQPLTTINPDTISKFLD